MSECRQLAGETEPMLNQSLILCLGGA